ncbi:MAG: phosphonate ABC transporter permease, partial [Lysobacteraceae bacterium]
MTAGAGRAVRLWLFAALYGMLIVASVVSFVRAGDLQFGRKPLQNLARTLDELSRPSFIDAWRGERAFAYRDDSGRVLRVEDRRAAERDYLWGLLEATWTTLKVATLGSLIAAVAALPFGVITARNMLA